MADSQILATQVSAAPLQYVIPGGQEIILRALFASFDGTGAAGAFLPCVRIVSDAGKVVGEYVTDSAVTAGNSADVSFAPFLRNAATSPTPSGASLPFAIAYRSGFNIPTSAGGSGANFDPWDYIDPSGTEIDLDGSGRVRFNTAGLYRVNFALQVFDSTWLGTDTMDLNFALLTGGLGNATSKTWPGKTTTVAPNNPSGSPRAWELAAEVWVNLTTVPEVVRMNTLQVTGGATHTASNTFAVMSALRVGDYSSGGVS